jgi:glycerophosphoryl diester phosphodiesterase
VTSVFAHRGATATALENTVEAFVDARRLGADGVELDVRRSADGALVVHHDPVISGGAPVADTTVAALPAHVPLFEAALDACAGMVVNVEIKADPARPGPDEAESLAHQVAEAVADAGWRQRVIVSTFELETARAVHRADPQLAVGLLVAVTADPRAALAEAAAAGLTAVHPFVAVVDADLVALAHRTGLAVNVWTVNNQVDMARLADLGVDSIITDRLELALSVVGGRRRAVPAADDRADGLAADGDSR